MVDGWPYAEVTALGVDSDHDLTHPGPGANPSPPYPGNVVARVNLGGRPVVLSLGTGSTAADLVALLRDGFVAR